MERSAGGEVERLADLDRKDGETRHLDNYAVQQGINETAYRLQGKTAEAEEAGYNRDLANQWKNFIKNSKRERRAGAK